MEIDRFSGVPAYQQLAAWLRERIRVGELTDRLPSAKAITAETGVAPFTAIKALRLLRSEGWARVSPGLGTYVAPRESWPPD